MDRLEAHQKLADTLKQHGYSITNARKIVFDVLFKHEPQTLHDIVSQAGSAADRSSIYRTLELFETLGIAIRLPLGWKYKYELSDEFAHHHHHFTCSRCGQIIPFEESAALQNEIIALAKQANFTPLAHQLEITGLCATCAKQNRL